MERFQTVGFIMDRNDNADHGIQPPRAWARLRQAAGGRSPADSRDEFGRDPNQPQRQGGNHRRILTHRRRERRHQDPFAHTQAPGITATTNPATVASATPAVTTGQALGATPVGETARTTAIWLKPNSTQPTNDHARPVPSKRYDRRGNASPPTFGNGNVNNRDTLGKIQR